MEKKLNNNKKANIKKRTKKKVTTQESNEESNIFLNTKDLSYATYYEKNVIGDGNCFFRVISYYYRKDENYYNEFRQLISDLLVENIEKFIDFSAVAYIVGDKEPENEE